jgi:hypothetical protein
MPSVARAIAVLACLAHGLVACATRPPPVPASAPPVEAPRAPKLAGCVGVSDRPLAATCDTVELPAPPATGDMAKRKAGKAAGGSVAVGAGTGLAIVSQAPAAAAGGGPVGPLIGGIMVVAGAGALAVGVIVAPVAALVGAGVGAAQAVPEEEREAELVAMRAALHDWQPGHDIAADLMAARTSAELVACRGETDCTDAAGTVPPATIVIVPLLPRFEADDAADPLLTLVVEADVEVRRNLEGTVERRRGYVFRAPSLAFTELTRNDAAALRAQQDQATRALADLIVADLFEPVSPVSPPPAP